MTYRFLLGVPFTDKDKAKDLGAKYRKIDVLSEWFIDLPKDTNNHEIFENFKPKKDRGREGGCFICFRRLLMMQIKRAVPMGKITRFFEP
jgi:hypothetical protein